MNTPKFTAYEVMYVKVFRKPSYYGIEDYATRPAPDEYPCLSHDILEANGRFWLFIKTPLGELYLDLDTIQEYHVERTDGDLNCWMYVQENEEPIGADAVVRLNP